MATKQIIFLKSVKTPYGDVAKGEILTGTEYVKKTTSKNKKPSKIGMPGFVFNFYEKKDPVKFADKTVQEIFFVPKTQFGSNKTIREVIPTDLKPKTPTTDSTLPKPDSTQQIVSETPSNKNKMISFAVGTLAGIVVSYFVFKKLKK